ncbi:hypothetical protein CBL_00224 [Carabus blaptoides fortunei]
MSSGYTDEIVDVHVTIYTDHTDISFSINISVRFEALVNRSTNPRIARAIHQAPLIQRTGARLGYCTFVHLYVSGTNRMANILQVFDKLDGFSASLPSPVEAGHLCAILPVRAESALTEKSERTSSVKAVGTDEKGTPTLPPRVEQRQQLVATAASTAATSSSRRRMDGYRLGRGRVGVTIEKRYTSMSLLY